MKIPLLLTLFPLMMPASVYAGTVLYTDSHHPPRNADASVAVIYLDGPEQLQAQIFGALPSDPDEAARQAQDIIRSPQWREYERQLTAAWRAVVRARELGIKKVPAVVFDDHDVVYGTADVAQAAALRAQGGR